MRKVSLLSSITKVSWAADAAQDTLQNTCHELTFGGPKTTPANSERLD